MPGVRVDSCLGFSREYSTGFCQSEGRHSPIVRVGIKKPSSFLNRVNLTKALDFSLTVISYSGNWWLWKILYSSLDQHPQPDKSFTTFQLLKFYYYLLSSSCGFVPLRISHIVILVVFLEWTNKDVCVFNLPSLPRRIIVFSISILWNLPI